MTKETSPASTPLSLFYRYPRMMQVLSLMGGFGLLSGGFVVAQAPQETPAPRKSTAAAPAVELIPAPASAPVATTKSQPTAPESIIVPEAPVVSKPAPAPVVREPEPAPAPVVREPAPATAPAASVRVPSSEAKPIVPAWVPEPVMQKKPVLAAPNLPVPSSSTVAKPPKIQLDYAPIQESAKSPVGETNNYIDRTDYSIGATPNYDGRPRVLFTERSTGCTAVSQNGQLSSGVCNLPGSSQASVRQPTDTPPTPSQLTAIRQQAIQQLAIQPTPIQSIPIQPTPIQKLEALQIANSGNQLQEPQLGGVLRLPTPPTVNVVSANLPPVQVLNSVISRTGPTISSNPSPVGSVPPVADSYYSSESSAAPGPESYYSSGSSAVPIVPSPNYYPSGSTTPSGVAYYNLTSRPAGRPSLGKTSFMFPLTLPAAMTSLFGWRVHPITGDRRFHTGSDIGAPEGTPVIAAASGQVATADFMGGYGLTVILRHEKNTQESLYAHLSEIFVRPGDMVEQGNVIARVGSTGNSTGPHLHFEWRHWTNEGWVAVDAGAHLEYSLAQFIRVLQFAQTPPQRGT